MLVDANNLRMVSTPRSKYAHALADFAGRSHWGEPTACGASLPNYDDNNPLHDRYADGKPPCPRCISALEWHIEWTQAFLASYRQVGGDS